MLRDRRFHVKQAERRARRPGFLVAALAVLALLLPAATEPARGEEAWRHGLSLFGAVKYPPGFARFDYVNPDAPKGGTVRLSAIGTFDSLNPFTFKGRPAGLLSLTYETLLTTSLDEPSSEYGLIAEAVSHPADVSSVSFRLDPRARWHDGEPVTVDDVIFSLDALRAAHPFYRAYYANIVKAERTGEREVTFIFDQAGNRELPLITGQLPVLPKHWWTGTRADGSRRDVGESTLEIPLGSGPYRIAEVRPGRSLALERVGDYWGRDLPVNVGQHNFDRVQLEYYRDDTIALEAFKADKYDWRTESSAKNWATAYDFPAVRDGRVALERFEVERSAGMQAFAFNLRRPVFRDARVRQAFNFAFDFEWLNRTLFYGQYVRTGSFFANSELAATGLPDAAELAILDPVRDAVPPEVFTEEFRNPVNAAASDQRANLRRAAELLAAAGWTVSGGRLVDSAGRQMDVEFLLVSPAFERVVLAYARNLERLGITVRVRTVDASQYQARTDTFDFDIVVANWGQSLSPGNEQRDFWGSAAAGAHGSRNLAGIENPAVDRLIERIIFAKDRDELVAATRALDRVLLWNHYVVPQWHIPYDRTARWNRFGRPDPIPPFSTGFPTVWWWDAARAAAAAERR